MSCKWYVICNNDKLRVFGIIMPIDRNKCILQQLGEGVQVRVHIDSPEYSTKVIYETLLLDFSNDKLNWIYLLVLMISKILLHST